MRSWLRFYLDRLRALEAERRVQRRFPHARLEPGVTVVSPHLLELGENVLIQRNALIHCGGMPWSDGRGRVAIGRDSTVSANCVVFGAGEVRIGARFGSGPGCMVFSSQDRFQAAWSDPGGPGTHLFAPVTIEDDVLLFAGVIVAPGVTIGRGAVVGAGSVVLDDVEPATLYAGSPARPIRELPDRR
jgi:acetyltransferase-like isoleucine patch superfamily enzyme